MRKTLITLFASLVVHAAPLALVKLPVAAARAPAPLDEPIDRWTGTTAELEGARVYDVSVDAPGAGHAGTPMPAAPPPTPPPALPPPAMLPDTASAGPAPRPVASLMPASPPRAEDGPKEPVPAKPSPSPARPRRAHAVATDTTAQADDASPRRPPGEAARRSEGGGTAEDSGGGTRAGSFGAEGPSAVRDLGRAFTRAIPPACQADPAWSKLAISDGGALEVEITVDETGHITGFKPPADDAPRHLVAVVKRTLALLEAGTFAIRSGSVSAGTEVLRLRASLSDVDESELGGTAGLSFVYDHGKGKAGFTQPGGRHIEISVEVVRVVVP